MKDSGPEKLKETVHNVVKSEVAKTPPPRLTPVPSSRLMSLSPQPHSASLQARLTTASRAAEKFGGRVASVAHYLSLAELSVSRIITLFLFLLLLPTVITVA